VSSDSRCGHLEKLPAPVRAPGKGAQAETKRVSIMVGSSSRHSSTVLGQEAVSSRHWIRTRTPWIVGRVELDVEA